MNRIIDRDTKTNREDEDTGVLKGMADEEKNRGGGGEPRPPPRPAPLARRRGLRLAPPWS